MKISFDDTFIIQNFENSHFCQNNYMGIVLKIGSKIAWNQRKGYFYHPKL